MTKKNYFKIITSQCNSCTLVWMCHGRGLNNRLNSLHERALRIVAYQNKKSDFEILCKNDSKKSLSQFRWETYIISSLKFAKLKKSISPENTREMFHFQGNENYNLRSGTHLASRNMRTTLLRKETVSNVGAKIWPLLT